MNSPPDGTYLARALQQQSISIRGARTHNLKNSITLYNNLARACLLALWRATPHRTYNVNDGTLLKMGDYFDLAADLFGMARPPRVSRAQAAEQLPPMMLSFMGESRRMVNQRMKQELGLRLRYATVSAGLLGA